MLRTEIYNRDDHSVKARISIGQKSGRLVETQGGIEVFPAGIKVRKGGVMYIPDTKNRPKRGKITGWSPASRRRLRQLLLGAGLPVPFVRYGITLTCPWDVEKWGEIGDVWRLAVDAFFKSLQRGFPSCAFIYRTELQTRGAPHMHGIFYAPADGSWIPKPFPSTVAHAFLSCQTLALWGRAMNRKEVPWTESAAKGAFDKVGVLVEELRNTEAAFRYCCDHASKRKQAQLGWQGRQWGVVNRKALVVSEGKQMTRAEWEQQAFLRVVRKMVRYRVKDARAPFGSRLSKKRSNLGVVFVGEGARERIMAFVDSLGRDRWEQVKEADREREAEWTAVKAELMGQTVDLLE